MTKNEFKRLQPGQIIQNKKDNKWSFIVHQNFGERLTAVRTIEVRDPENWEVITKVKIEDSFAPYDTPEIKKAAAALCLTMKARMLHESLKAYDWYQTVGIGDKELFIYTNKKKHPKPIMRFEGFPINYRYMGKITPA